MPRTNTVESTIEHKLSKNSLSSSFPGISRYSGIRGVFNPNIFDWLEVKRRDDNIGELWRVHDKLYDLEEFKFTHPGGKDWIEFSKGTDITEAFESSHFINLQNVERILAKYYVAEAKAPRNSPYSFERNGFYKTLKKKAEPIIKKVGMEPSKDAIFIIDSLAIIFMLLALVGLKLESTIIQIAAGITLGKLTGASHNFFHKKDNWRRYYFDLSTLSSYDWRISHGFSHHLFPNTILDFEVLLGEPVLEMLPIRRRTFFHKYILPFIIDLLYSVFGLVQIPMRIHSILQGKQKLRPENLLVILELVVLISLSSVWHGFLTWLVIISSSSFWFAFVSNNSSHHHPTCFHDGDDSRPNPDFGLCQLDATAYKTDWYHQNLFSVLTTFGEHPLHHLFPTVCHGKLKYLKPILDETLAEFSEQVLEFTQLELFIGTHQQMRRSVTHKFRDGKIG